MLRGKKILVGVTGSIAAYKAAILVRLLVREGAEVRVVMTPLAKQFITPLTLATLCKHPVPVEFFNPENGEWNSHVSLGTWADAYLIAPATANTIAKMATGVADNLLLTTYLSARCPVFIAPAMDLDMYSHPTTQYNLDSLKSYGNQVIEPAEGELASGLSGKGRMEEPEKIVAFVSDFFAKKRNLTGKTILVTAGPTIEPIDPVRYISNFSSGKMGYAIAAELKERGAEVILVTGKTALTPPDGVQTVDVVTAEQMFRAATKAFDRCDAAVMCAAVADYTPADYSDDKVKKREGDLSIPLKRTQDILKHLGELRRPDQIKCGFSMETRDMVENSRAKLEKKKVDMICANNLKVAGAGFGVDTNVLTLITADGAEELPLMSKEAAAGEILDAALALVP